MIEFEYLGATLDKFSDIEGERAVEGRRVIGSNNKIMMGRDTGKEVKKDKQTVQSSQSWSMQPKPGHGMSHRGCGNESFRRSIWR